MKREQLKTRKIRLVGKPQVDTLIKLIHNLPIDEKNPIEIVIREEVKTRKLDQNGLYWACQLKDISDQSYVNGRTYSLEIWHEHFKEQFLPDDVNLPTEELQTLVKEGYRKFAISPSGKYLLVGSTADLTIKGFSIYLQQVEAFGANLGVQFGVRESGFA